MEGNFSQRNPQTVQGNTLRERLESTGRLAEFEARTARRRRERALNPTAATEDVMRARQRLESQKVFDEYLRPETAQPKLTGEGHPNPTMEERGGKVGMAVSRLNLPLLGNVRGEIDRDIFRQHNAALAKRLSPVKDPHGNLIPLADID
jgi:hypothetical protein